jgi:hypothetical protein
MPSMCMQSMSNGQNTCCYLPTRDHPTYAWTDAGMRRPAAPLEDAMFNTVADEIDGFDLGTNAGCASYRPRGGPATGMLPACSSLAAVPDVLDVPAWRVVQ